MWNPKAWSESTGLENPRAMALSAELDPLHLPGRCRKSTAGTSDGLLPGNDL